MLLREWDWSAQAYVEVEYPDEVVKKFVDTLRNNKQWRESPDPGRDVYSMFRRFEDALSDARQEVAKKKAADAARMAKAREALAAKREAEKAAVPA